MAYIKASGSTVEKYPYSIGLLRKDNPNTSFPKRMSDQQLAYWNVYHVVTEDDPVYDSVTQYVQVASQPTLVNGVWTLTKSVMDYTAQELENRLAAKRERMACTPRQARLALAQTGRYGAVKSFMAGLPVDQKETAEISWEYATSFERTSGLLITLTAAMGMTEQEVDELFELAATL